MRKQIVLGIVLFASLLVGTACGQSLNELNDQLGSAVAYYYGTPGDKAKVESLLAAGADINAKNEYGTPILISALQGDHRREVVELLIAHGANVNTKNTKDYFGMPLLSMAVLKNYKEIVELLIAHGAYVNATNNSGDSPLYIAVGNGYKDMAELLIAHGADLNYKSEGKTALQRADSCQFDAQTKQAIVALLQEQMAKQAQITSQADPQQLLNGLLMQFKGQPANDELRKSIIELTLKVKPAPTIPPEAEAAAGRGTYIFKNAKSPDEVLNAAKEYLAAIEVAPWVANYYFNLCTVLEKTPYSQQALHACKLYLVAAPDATDASAVRQRIAGLQYVYDRDKAQMKQRTRYINKAPGVEGLYRFGGITNKVSDKDIVLKLFVDWGAAPPKYQVYAGCFGGDGVYGVAHDLVSTDNWMMLCNPEVNMHLVIKPEGEGFVEVSDSNGGSLRATLNDLFKAKQQTMAQAVMFSTLAWIIHEIRGQKA
jgi:hypothetical protein